MTGPGAARVAAALLVVTAGLFAIGAARERGDVHAEATATYGAESGESSEQHAAETAADAGTTGEERAILGVDPEAPGLVALVVVASIGLAAGLWFTGKRGLALCTAALAGLFAVLDVAEVTHQLDDNRAGLAVLASVIALGHAAVALSAGHAARQAKTPQEVP